MFISDKTISALGCIITGNKTINGECIAPYRTGPELVKFFNNFGWDDSYGRGFPSRWQYAISRIESENGTETLKEIILVSLEPIHFLDFEHTSEEAVDYLNRYLEYDGYEIIIEGKKNIIRDIRGTSVDLTIKQDGLPKLTLHFIEEHIAKCDRKISEGDYNGAITNARSLLETVILAIQEDITGASDRFEGNLVKMFRQLQKHLNLDPSREDVSDSLRQVLTGLISIVSGLAPMRNIMSDSHGTTYRPTKHHAKLAVNAAKTISDFLFETYDYQKSKGLISR
ncbi:MAG: abortive infection family protein [Deltaproteobacteria bacterium]|nr:abortive infection family protein [Candidatus Zymogenaceae bacterium]